MSDQLGALWRGVAFGARLLLSPVIPLPNGARILWTRIAGSSVSTSGDDEIEVVIYGLVLRIPKELATLSIRAALCSGGYEASEVLVFEELVAPQARVLEIGSGVGFLAAYMARDKRTQSVVSIEADARLVPVARANCSLNGAEVTILHRAVGTSTGTAQFALHPDFWASSTQTWSGAQLVEVSMGTLDDSIEEFKPNVLVMDAEGAEYSLLRHSALIGVDTLIVDLHPWQSSAAQDRELFAALGAAGFRHLHRRGWGNVHGFLRR
jgi:FkbM family methyltransferase